MIVEYLINSIVVIAALVFAIWLEVRKDAKRGSK